MLTPQDMALQNLSMFDKYVNSPDPSVRECANNWRTAIGLQAVDGLTVSDYLIQLAVRNLEGELTMDEVNALLEQKYRKNRYEVFSSEYEIVPETANRNKYKCTMDEIAVLRTVRLQPELTIKQLAEKIRKSEDDVRRITENLIAHGMLRHEHGKEEGDWDIVYDY